jgi:hypothetical protein
MPASLPRQHRRLSAWRCLIYLRFCIDPIRCSLSRRVAQQKSDRRRVYHVGAGLRRPAHAHRPLQCPSKEGLRSHERNCPQHCQTSKRNGFIKMRKSHILAKSTPTLTQSGLLAVLLQRQRDKVIELAERRAHRSQSRSTFSSVLTWLLACARAAASARPFHRGVGGTLPRHP